MKKILLFFTSILLFTACYTTYTSVGNYQQLEKQGYNSYQYDQAKQFYLFGGLIPLGHSQANLPNDACQIKEKFKFFDLFLSTITCDILCCRTIQVYALEGGVNQLEQNVQPQKVEEPQTEEIVKTDKKKKQEQIAPEQKKETKTDTTSAKNKKEKVEKKDVAIKETPKEATPTIVEEPIQQPIVNTSEPEVIEPEPIVQPTKTTQASIIEQGAILAPFTVSPTKKVYFSKGNLQYQASSKTWRFAEHQYDMIGTGNASISAENSNWIDLFGWATSGWNNGNKYYMPYNTDALTDMYGYGYGPTNGQTYNNSLQNQYAEADWGIANQIQDAGETAGMWRTMSRGEWGYLLLKRESADKLYSLATVNEVKGIILLPDNWELPQGCSFNPISAYSKNVYTTEQWSTMEANGAVFLPSAGCRYGKTIGNVGTTGSYWTISSAERGCAWYFMFNNNKIDVTSEFSRGLGRSVRLVKDLAE